MHAHRIDHDLYRGTLDIIVLSLIAERSDHGYGIIERVKARSGGMLEVSEGAIYPLLHRLESKKLIRAEWTMSSNNRRTKQYIITELGEGALRDRSCQWRAFSKVVGTIIDGLTPPEVEARA